MALFGPNLDPLCVETHLSNSSSGETSGFLGQLTSDGVLQIQSHELQESKDLFYLRLRQRPESSFRSILVTSVIHQCFQDNRELVSSKHPNPLDPLVDIMKVTIDSLPLEGQGSKVTVMNEGPENFYASDFLCGKKSIKAKLSSELVALNQMGSDKIVQVVNTGI